MRLVLRIASGIALTVAAVSAQESGGVRQPALPDVASAELMRCDAQPAALPGCTPAVAGPNEPLVKGAGCGAVLTVAPVPGGAGRLGVLFYSIAGLRRSPLQTSSGATCLSDLQRAGSSAALPGGTEGRCDGAYTWDLQRIVDASSLLAPGDAFYVQAWYRNPLSAVAISTPAAGPFVVQGTFFPTITGVTPSAGGEGTLLTITGSDFGTNPLDLQVLLAGGVGFADVTAVTTPASQAELQSQAGSPLSATVFSVGGTASGPVTMIRGTGSNVAGQNVVAGGITSNSSLVRQLVDGLGSNFGSYNLTPGSASTVSANVGAPMPGGLTLDMTQLTGTVLEYRICLKHDGTDKFYAFQGRIDFVVPPAPTAVQMAEHLAAHLNKSFLGLPPSLTASASAGIPPTSTVRISTAGAAYGGVVVSGK
jgi:hypothetical protein